MGAKATTMDAAIGAEADRVYGLEPVLDTGHDGRQSQLQKFVRIDCPYCGGSYDTAVDLTLGAQDYIEDCQVCCRSIELVFDVVDGVLKGLDARRTDGV